MNHYQSIAFILIALVNFCLGLSTVSVPATNSISQHITFSDHIQLSSDGRLCVKKAVKAGTKLIEWHEGACLTPEAAFSDMDVGLRLRELAPRVGPGFELVALATLLGAEYVRNFQTRPSAFMPEGGDDRFFTEIIPSQWAEVTQDIWADAAKSANDGIDPELEPIIEQGVMMALPIVDATMRRAWSSGMEGKSGEELRRIMRMAFHLMLRNKYYSPSKSGHWGWRKGAPSGPALLPLLRNLIDGNGAIRSDNAVLLTPSHPENGARDKNVCLQCIATADLPIGETIYASAD